MIQFCGLVGHKMEVNRFWWISVELRIPPTGIEYCVALTGTVQRGLAVV